METTGKEVQIAGTCIQFTGFAQEELTIRYRLVAAISAVLEENVKHEVSWRVQNPLARKALESACEEFSLAVRDILDEVQAMKHLAREISNLWPADIVQRYDPSAGRLDLAAM